MPATRTIFCCREQWPEELRSRLGGGMSTFRKSAQVEIKHGGQAFLYNFLGREFGNPNRPQKALAVAQCGPPIRPDGTPASADQDRVRIFKAVGMTNTPLPQANRPRRERAADCWNCGMMLLADSVDCIHCGSKNR